jgi:hypothetical protein
MPSVTEYPHVKLPQFRTEIAARSPSWGYGDHRHWLVNGTAVTGAPLRLGGFEPAT